MLTRLKHYFQLLRTQKHPLRFVTGYFLKKTRLCKLVTFRVQDFKLHFFPTALSLNFFANPTERTKDAKYLAKLLSEGDCFVDVGANIGTLTIPGAKIVGPKGKIFSFEAHPRTVYYLRKNLELNELGFVQTFDKAVGDKPGTISFTDESTDEQNHVQADGTICVEVVRLDQVLPQDLKISFLKIDTEGFELPVFKSCESIFPNIELVYFESDERHCKSYGYSTSDLIAYLLDRNLSVLRVSEDKLWKLDYGYVSLKRENLFAVRNAQSLADRLGLAMMNNS